MLRDLWDRKHAAGTVRVEEVRLSAAAGFYVDGSWQLLTSPFTGQGEGDTVCVRWCLTSENSCASW